MVILGIDPGTATTGYGVVKTTPGGKGRKAGLAWVAHGTIETPKGMSPQERLWMLERGLEKVLGRYKPALLAVERLYFFKNVKTALPVSEARGIVLLLGAKKGIPIREFTPPQAKMAVTGYGKAQKKQVQRMVQQILGLKALPRPDDAADALALCIASSVLTKGLK